jgi:hypothetical protein
MVDSNYFDGRSSFVDPVDQPVGAASGNHVTLQLPEQGLSHLARALQQRSDHEFDNGVRYLRWHSGELALRRWRDH